MPDLEEINCFCYLFDDHHGIELRVVRFYPYTCLCYSEFSCCFVVIVIVVIVVAIGLSKIKDPLRC